MIRIAFLAMLALAALASNAEARQRHKTYLAHPDCNVLWPCQDVGPSARGERIVKAMGGFGAAQKVYKPRIAKADLPLRYSPKAGSTGKAGIEIASYGAPTPSVAYMVSKAVSQIVAHPAGCPARSFCGCGAAVRVFGSPVRDLWLAANWLKFPRAAPAPGMVAARRGHVFVLEAHMGGNTWQVYDANSGGRKTRIHARSLAGYQVVNPHGSRYASAT